MQNNKVLIGADLGGSLNKIVVISTYQLQLDALEHYYQTIINQKKLYIFTGLFKEPVNFFTTLKNQLLIKDPQIHIGLTGCGGVKYQTFIKNIFNEAQYINQFEANPQGLYAYDKIGMKISLHHFIQSQNSQIQYTTQENHRISDITSHFMFVSLGSGVNFQKFGHCQNGIQRKKVQDPQTSYDGYSLGGTCLGSSFLIGLISTLQDQKNKQNIIKSIKQDESTKDIYDMVIVNLLQHSLTLSIVHKLNYILICGNILKIKCYISEQFKAALRLNHNQKPLKRTLIELNSLGGFIGALGTISKYI